MKSRVVAWFFGVLVATVLCLPAQAASSLVTVEAVTVEPQSPAPGAHCRLSVRLKNTGTQTATYFRFEVKIDGEEQAAYERYMYAAIVAPGATATIDLFNFYSPAAHAAFPVVVTLSEAQWAEVKWVGQTNMTTPVGPVRGLPVSSKQTINAASSK